MKCLHPHKHGIVCSNPTRGMDVCPRFLYVCVSLCREWPCDRDDHTFTSPIDWLLRSIASDKFWWELATGPNTKGRKEVSNSTMFYQMHWSQSLMVR
jgi:hypothetical protein